jgi:hypothetical protein
MFADIITRMADNQNIGRRNAPNSLTIIWVTEDNNFSRSVLLLQEERIDVST